MDAVAGLLKEFLNNKSVCEECGDLAITWVSDVTQFYAVGSMVVNYKPHSTHAFCDQHKRESYIYDWMENRVK